MNSENFHFPDVHFYGSEWTIFLFYHNEWMKGFRACICDKVIVFMHVQNDYNNIERVSRFFFSQRILFGFALAYILRSHVFYSYYVWIKQIMMMMLTWDILFLCIQAKSTSKKKTCIHGTHTYTHMTKRIKSWMAGFWFIHGNIWYGQPPVLYAIETGNGTWRQRLCLCYVVVVFFSLGTALCKLPLKHLKNNVVIMTISPTIWSAGMNGSACVYKK